MSDSNADTSGSQSDETTQNVFSFAIESNNVRGMSQQENPLTSCSPAELKLRTLTKKDIPKLVSFVPRQLLPILETKGEVEPCHRTSHAIVMLADISGFTKLSEALCSKGPAGVDELSEITSDFLGELIQIVKSYNGDIVSFAGDALIITCPIGQNGANVEQTLRVFKCGLELSQLSRPSLTLHVGISSGLTTFCVVGGAGNYWCCLVIGEAIIRVGDAEKHANSQECVVTLEAFREGQEYCKGDFIEEERNTSNQMIGDPNRKKGLVRLTEVELAPGMSWAPSDEINIYDMSSLFVGRDVETRIELFSSFSLKLQSFIPEPAKEVLRGQGQFLNEFRKRISVLFVMLDDFPVDIYNPNHDGKEIRDMFQDILAELQRVLFSHNGLLRQFIVDDKGCVFIACFGVTGHTHRDDPSRALSCGLALAAAAQTKNIKTYMGLTTGAAFCGAVGSVQRREYAMVGKDVNLAARLMSFARKNSFSEPCYLICDDLTYKETKGEPHVNFEALEPVKLKGSENLVPIYKATPSSSLPVQTKRRDSVQGKGMAGQTLVGREEEIQRIVDRVTNDSSQDPDDNTKTASNLSLSSSVSRKASHKHFITIVEGSQGIGKSSILHHVKGRVEKLGEFTLYAKALVNSKSTPYIVFKQLFWSLLLGTDAEKVSSLNKEELEGYRKEVFFELLDEIATRHYESVEKSKKEKIEKEGKVAHLAALDVSNFASSSSSGKTSSSMFFTPKGNRANQNSEFRYGRSSSKKVTKVKPSAEGSHGGSSGGGSDIFGKSRRMSDPNLGGSLISRERALVQGEGSAKRHYLETVAFPFLKSILRISWNLENKSETGPKSSFSDLAHGGNSGQYVITTMLQIILERYEKNHQVLSLFIDDAHFLDSMSASTILSLFRTASCRVSLVMTQKPLDKVPASITDLLMAYQSQRIELKSLDRDQLIRVIELATEGTQLAENVTEFILEQSQGNPGICKELSMSLREADASALMENTELTQLVEHAIQARFDRLPDNLRALLKTSAVIGNVFPLAAVHAMVPRYISRKGMENLISMMKELVSGEWLDVVHDHNDEVLYAFRSDLVREICYNLNTSRNLRMLHISCAQFFQKTYDEDLRPYFSVLSYHFKLSQQDTMALKYMIYSFRLNLIIGAIPEAGTLLDQILLLKVEKQAMLDALAQIREAIEYCEFSDGFTDEFADAFIPQTNKIDGLASSSTERTASSSVSVLKRSDSFARSFDINLLLTKVNETKRTLQTRRDSLTESNDNNNAIRGSVTAPIYKDVAEEKQNTEGNKKQKSKACVVM